MNYFVCLLIVVLSFGNYFFEELLFIVVLKQFISIINNKREAILERWVCSFLRECVMKEWGIFQMVDVGISLYLWFSVFFPFELQEIAPEDISFFISLFELIVIWLSYDVSVLMHRVKQQLFSYLKIFSKGKHQILLQRFPIFYCSIKKKTFLKLWVYAPDEMVSLGFDSIIFPTQINGILSIFRRAIDNSKSTII